MFFLLSAGPLVFSRAKMQNIYFDFLSAVFPSGGFSVRPFVRSIQRQSLSSRSSVASPLALSDGGVKPSWSLSAKLHMRSNSPSRFSLDSRCSPPLERIGEAGDDKVSTSCFGSYSRHERYFGSRSPLSSVESNAGEQDGGKRFLDMVYCRAPTPTDKKSGKSDSTENNNQITAVDQNIVSAQATPTKEPKRKSSVGGFASKLESAASAKSGGGKTEQEKTSKKRLCSTLKTPETSAATPLKGKRASGAKEKSAGGKKSTATPSGTPSKRKEQPQEQRSCGCPTPQSSASPSPPANKSPASSSSAAVDKGTASGRRRLVERSCSRDSMHSSPAVGGAIRGSPLTRSSAPKAVGGSESGARRLIRSSSSSSSVTSLRSPSVATRGSKPEEKGLSFFKNALRQRESRRSADLGKSSLLARKSSERTSKQNGAAREAAPAGGGEKAKAGDASSPPPSTSTSTDDTKSEAKATARPAGSLGRSLLAVAKSKSSSAEGGVKSPAASGKRPLDRVASSRKLSSPARTAPRPQ